jgi:hypothetical protein
MAIASQSLQNMSVYTGGDNGSNNQGLLFPKLKYRFRASFLNFGVAGTSVDLTKQVMDIKRPSVDFGEVPLHVYNSTIYIAGKHSWAETSVQVRDDALGSVAKIIGQQVQKQMDMVEQSSAATAQDYKFQLNYELLDGGNGALEPTILETWELYGCYIKSVDYGNMDYSSSDPATINMSIRFDNAVQSPLSAGIGIRVGRAFGGQAATGIGSI